MKFDCLLMKLLVVNMKNNRLRNCEVIELRKCVEEIRHFASMESARFGHGNDEIDKLVKEEVKLYMRWFNSVANKIEFILDNKYDDYY